MGKKRTYGISLELRGKDMVSGMLGRVHRTLSKLGAPLRMLGSIGRGIGSFIDKIPGLSILGSGIANVVGQIKDMALAAAEAGSGWKDLAAQTGIGTRALQEVAYAANQAGVPLEEFRSMMQRFTATVGKGVKGKSLLASLGKNAAGFAKSLNAATSPTEKFELALAQMAALKDPAKRAAFAVQMFGKAGVRLAGAGAEGAEGIKRLRKEAERLGLVMSDAEIDRADDFGDKWAAIGKAFEATKRDFGSGVIEGLLPGLDDLLQLVKENRKEVSDFAKELGKKVGKGIVDVANAIADAVEWIVENKTAVADTMEKIGIGVAALMGLSALGPILMTLSANPLFAALAAAVVHIKALQVLADPMGHVFPGGWENPHEQGTRAADAFDLSEYRKRGLTPPTGLLERLGVAGPGARDDKWAATGDEGAIIRQAIRVASENPDGAQNDWMRGMSVMPDHSIMPTQSIDLNLNIMDPGDMLEGKPGVKAPKGSKVTTNKRRPPTGRSPLSYLHGGER